MEGKDGFLNVGPAVDGFHVLAPTARHREAWAALYAQYASFYGVEQTQHMRERVWGWLQDPAHELEGAIVLDGSGVPVGLAHYRAFTRPLAAGTGCYLDDLFVDPAARGSGAAEALIRHVRNVARQRGHSVVRWMTAEDNYRARGLYDRLARRTGWLTYELEP